MIYDSACRCCGAIGGHVLTLMETGHHWARLGCGHCGAWIKWVAKPRTQEEERIREQNKRQYQLGAMAKVLPTEKQLAFITAHHRQLQAGATRLDAYHLIDLILKEGQ